MTDAIFGFDPTNLTIDRKDAQELGLKYAETYQSGEPYHHICIDNFLPMQIIDQVRSDIETMDGVESRTFEAAEEKLKTQYNPDRMPAYTRQLFQSFNSRPFIAFLEKMTGIDGLIPDPYFVGAGIHKTQNGGYLNIHADFNLHPHMKLERRLNILIYLNPPWKAEWGGSFEVWDKPMETKVASFEPTENRMVCFSTGSDTWHGNPEPVNHPDGLPRQSIALYYYTATWDETRVAHSTLFKPRPGTEDFRSGTRAKIGNVAKEALPPFLYRNSLKVMRKLRV